MTTDDMVSLIRARMAQIGARLDEGMSLALTEAERRIGDLVRDGALHLRSLTMRAELRRYLVDAELPGWKVGGDQSKMGQLLLNDEDYGLSLRVLKERRHTYPGGVPVAGHNAARRAAWQEPLPLLGDVVSSAPVPPSTSLLLLWDLRNPHTIDDGYTLRAVHTLAAGIYGQPVPCDLSIDIERGGELHTRLQFRGGSDPEDFFLVDVDEVEDQGGS